VLPLAIVADFPWMKIIDSVLGSDEGSQASAHQSVSRYRQSLQEARVRERERERWLLSQCQSGLLLIQSRVHPRAIRRGEGDDFRLKSWNR